MHSVDSLRSAFATPAFPLRDSSQLQEYHHHLASARRDTAIHIAKTQQFKSQGPRWSSQPFTLQGISPLVALNSTGLSIEAALLPGSKRAVGRVPGRKGHGTKKRKRESKVILEAQAYLGTPPVGATFLESVLRLRRVSFLGVLLILLAGMGLDASTSNIIVGCSGWIFFNMICYVVRRGQLHKITAWDAFCRHFDPHPYFGVVFAGWIAFLGAYLPCQIVLELIFGCSLYYYYYPQAKGCGLLVEKKQRPEGQKARPPFQIRVDWHRFKLCVSRKTENGRWVGHSALVNLPHIDIPTEGVKHWPWKQSDTLRNIVKKLCLTEEQLQEEQRWHKREEGKLGPSRTADEVDQKRRIMRELRGS